MLVEFYIPAVSSKGLVYLEYTEYTLLTHCSFNFIPNSEGKPYLFHSQVDAINWVFENIKDELIFKNHQCYVNIDPKIYRSWYLKDPSIK